MFRSLFRFRDALWLVVIFSLLVAWYLDRRSISIHSFKAQFELRQQLLNQSIDTQIMEAKVFQLQKKVETAGSE